MKPTIDEISIRLAPKGSADHLIGWVSFVVGKSMKVNNVALVRTKGGELQLQYPKETGSNGKKYTLFHPISKDYAQEIERAVFNKLKTETGTHD